MNISDKLDNALQSFPAPFYRDFYVGEGEDYGYYDQMTDTPDGFGDDFPEIEIQSAYVHFFTKTGQKAKHKTIKNLLWRAGLRIKSSYEQHELDTGYTHFTYEVETFEVIKEE